MANKEILGHINCPHCGIENGMRITLDKSGAPFGYCEGDCSGQMRVGGNASRVEKFYRQYPHIKEQTEAIAAEITQKKTLTEAVAVKVEGVPVPEKKKAPKVLTVLEMLKQVAA